MRKSPCESCRRCGVQHLQKHTFDMTAQAVGCRAILALDSDFGLS